MNYDMKFRICSLREYTERKFEIGELKLEFRIFVT